MFLVVMAYVGLSGIIGLLQDLPLGNMGLRATFGLRPLITRFGSLTINGFIRLKKRVQVTAQSILAGTRC